MKPIHCVSNAIVLGALACEQSASTTTTTSATTGDARSDRNEDVIVSLTVARCHREVNCNNIGGGKRYPNDTACFREVDQNMRPNIRESACPIVDTGALRSCLDAIENETCGNAVERLDELAACRPDTLCKN
jgi:hypothetical protein